MVLFRRIAPLALVALVALVVAAATTTTIATQGRNKRIVIVAGRPSHPPGMHEFRAGSLLLQKALAGVKGVTVDVIPMGWPKKTVDGKEVDDNAAFDGADAVFIYADGGGGHPAIQGNRREIIQGLADKGVGLGFAHFGVEVPRTNGGPEFLEWIGGYYEHQYSVNPMWTPDYKTFPDHPATRGVKPFRNRDEWYFNIRFRDASERITPLLVALPSDEVRRGPYVYPKGPYDHIVAQTGRHEVMMWAFERANSGRSFGFTGGHTHAHWGNPNQLKIFLNALLWIAKAEVPKDGVESTVTPEQLAANLDPKKK